MNKRKFLFCIITLLAIVIFVWTSSDAFAQEKGAKPDAATGRGVKPDVVKGKVTRDDVAKYLGKKGPTELKAAAKRARDLGCYPGVAAYSAQLPGPTGAPHTN